VSIRYGLPLAIAALDALAKSPAPLSLRQQHWRLYRSARDGVSGGEVEVGKVIARDEPVERHPARHEKIDEARDEVSGRLRLPRASSVF
jgi:hypothetical protein